MFGDHDSRNERPWRHQISESDGYSEKRIENSEKKIEESRKISREITAFAFDLINIGEQKTLNHYQERYLYSDDNPDLRDLLRALKVKLGSVDDVMKPLDNA